MFFFLIKKKNLSFPIVVGTQFWHFSGRHRMLSLSVPKRELIFPPSTDRMSQLNIGISKMGLGPQKLKNGSPDHNIEKNKIDFKKIYILMLRLMAYVLN